MKTQHFAYLCLHIFHRKCWRKTQDHVVCVCFHDLKCQGALEGSINLTVFPQINYSGMVPRLPTLLPPSSLPADDLTPQFTEKNGSSQKGSSTHHHHHHKAPTCPWVLEALPIHLCSPPRPHSPTQGCPSSNCLFSLLPQLFSVCRRQAPWLGCGSFPKKGGTSGAPFALSE